VFGMEDGTVSIFGLVFGIAASASSSQTVLLAGATGAISAAVSMMAGTYLDVSTDRDQARAAIAAEQRKIEEKPQREAEEFHDRLKQEGFSDTDAQTILTIIERTPGTLLKGKTAFELQLGKSADWFRPHSLPCGYGAAAAVVGYRARHYRTQECSSDRPANAGDCCRRRIGGTVGELTYHRPDHRLRSRNILARLVTTHDGVDICWSLSVTIWHP
jgi:hypothetical protein